jgi:hypothetical protein
MASDLPFNEYSKSCLPKPIDYWSRMNRSLVEDLIMLMLYIELFGVVCAWLFRQQWFAYIIIHLIYLVASHGIITTHSKYSKLLASRVEVTSGVTYTINSK